LALALALSLACAAGARAACANPGVLLGELVPALAVGLRRADASGTTRVLSMRYDFEMVGVDAALDAAQVIDDEPIWDRSAMLLIEVPMSAV
jgi:hypothetical protein